MLHGSFLGKGKKTSHLSRSSSGFESSHLPSPEYPTPPLSQSSSRQDPQSLLPPFQTSIKAVHLGTSRCLLRRTRFSQSYDELLCVPVCQGLWKRSLSLDYQIHHRREPCNAEDSAPAQSVKRNALQQNYNHTEQNEAVMSQACANQEDESEDLATGDELTFPSVDSSNDVESEEVPVDGAEISQDLHHPDLPTQQHRIKPQIPPKPLTLSFVNEKHTTNSDIKHISQAVYKSATASGIPKFSKPFIHRLGKKVHARSSNLELLVEEKLSMDGIDLTEEPYSDKVFYYIQELFMFSGLLYYEHLFRVLRELW